MKAQTQPTTLESQRESFPTAPTSRKPLILIILVILLALGLIGVSAYIICDKMMADSAKDCNCATADNDKFNGAVQLINFDKNNCLNNDLSAGYEISRLGRSEFVDGIFMSVDDDGNVLTQIYYNQIFPDKYTGVDLLTDSSYREEKTLVFDKKVEFIFGGRFASDPDGMIYLFLLEDGTLEYMRYSDVYNSQKFEHQPVDGVEGIVRFDNIYYNQDSQPTGGRYTAIAYRADGKYYDLSQTIK